jgi:hypothetical protein
MNFSSKNAIVKRVDSGVVYYATAKLKIVISSYSSFTESFKICICKCINTTFHEIINISHFDV